MLGIYTRLSKQDEESNSINNQLREGKQFAADFHYSDIKIYNEGEGVSGGLDIVDRPKLKELMGDIKSGLVTSLWVRNQNRLERNSLTYATFVQTVKSYKCKVYFNGVLQDYNNPNDNLLGGILSQLNSYKLELQSEQTKKVLRDNVIAGKSHARIPYGYTKDENNFLIIDKDEAKIIKKVYKWSLEGIGTNKIADRLNELGVPTAYNKMEGTLKVVNKYDKQDITTVKKSEIKWSGNTIRGFIKNSHYKGVRVFSGNEYECPAIFDAQYWQQVNDNLKKNANNSGKVVSHKYLLKGLLRCGKCGRNMYGRTRVNKKDNYYMCSSKRHKHLNCGNRGININFLEKFIMSKFYGDYKLYDKVKEHFNSLNNNEELERLGDKLKSHKTALKGLKKEFDRVMDTYIKEMLSLDEFGKYKKSYDTKIIDETLIINNLESQIKNIKGISSKNTLEGLKLKENLTFNSKRKILHQYIKNIKIEYIDDYYYIETNFNIEGYRERKELVHKSYKYFMVGSLKYYLKAKPQKTTLERVFEKLNNKDFLKDLID
ncbi:recombinase family protein [Flavobacteriaceae bacterium]|nr:recombinase family protein [Flavobacteriaceae bacterium]